MPLLDEDRLFPIEPSARAIARELYAEVRDLPIVSPHGHTDPRWYAEDAAFPDPAQLFVIPDHYVFRMLHSQGVPLADLGVPRADGGPTETDGRAIWRRLAENYHLLRGTPSRLWLDHTFETLFGLDRRLSAETADHYYDHIADCLARPEFRPRALFDRFGIEVIATTESPLDDLRWHAMVRDSGWGGRVVTAYRPDAVVDPEFPGFAANVARLAEITGRDTGDLGRLPRRAPRPPRLLQGARRHLERPRPPDRPHREPRADRGRGAVRPRARRPGLARGSRRLPRPDADRDGADEPRRRPRAADPPGLVPQPLGRGHARLRPRQGLRHPDAHRLRPGAEAAARRGRPAQRPDDHPLHPRRSRPTPASSPRSPASIRRSGSARPGGSSTAPRACAASAS